jgi:hypothetical protein
MMQHKFFSFRVPSGPTAIFPSGNNEIMKLGCKWGLRMGQRGMAMTSSNHKAS